MQEEMKIKESFKFFKLSRTSKDKSLFLPILMATIFMVSLISIGVFIELKMRENPNSNIGEIKLEKNLNENTEHNINIKYIPTSNDLLKKEYIQKAFETLVNEKRKEELLNETKESKLKRLLVEQANEMILTDRKRDDLSLLYEKYQEDIRIEIDKANKKKLSEKEVNDLLIRYVENLKKSYEREVLHQ